MVDDVDPKQAANLLLQQHGENAAQYAAQWANAMLETGNRREARKFEQIVDTIHGMTRQTVRKGRSALKM